MTSFHTRLDAVSRYLRGSRSISTVLDDAEAFLTDLEQSLTHVNCWGDATETGYTWVLALPGFKKADVVVEAMDIAEGAYVAIRAMRTNANGDRYPVAFRTITLPSDADSTKVEAKLEDGLLVITVQKLAKPSPPAPRKVTVS